LNSKFTKLFLVASLIISAPVFALDEITDMQDSILLELPTYQNFSLSQYTVENLANKNNYLFLLSNKDLVRQEIKKTQKISNKISIPNVYTISLKPQLEAQPVLAQISTPAVSSISENLTNVSTSPIVLYNYAKNGDTSSKIDVAIKLIEINQISTNMLAEDLLNEVLKSDSENPYAYYLKGNLDYNRKKYEDAMKNYVTSYKLNPYSVQSCLGIAKILDKTNKQLAQKYYEKAQMINIGIE